VCFAESRRWPEAAAGAADGNSGKYGGGGEKGDRDIGRKSKRERELGCECGGKTSEREAEERQWRGASGELHGGGERFVVWRAV
jgi:hypothetical protein